MRCKLNTVVRITSFILVLVYVAYFLDKLQSMKFAVLKDLTTPTMVNGIDEMSSSYMTNKALSYTSKKFNSPWKEVSSNKKTLSEYVNTGNTSKENASSELSMYNKVPSTPKPDVTDRMPEEIADNKEPYKHKPEATDKLPEEEIGCQDISTETPEVTEDQKDADDKHATSSTDAFSRFLNRRQRLERFCRRDEFKGSWVPVAQNLIVDKKRKLVYCEVPKVGSTFWKGVLAILTDNSTDSTSPSKVVVNSDIHHTRFLRFNKLSQSQQKAVLNSGHLMLFVRDPYMRLLSAYMDKFVRPNKYYWQRYGTLITNSRSPQNEKTDDQCGQDVTFQEFITFFALNQLNGNKFASGDHHWTSVYKLCSPCHYPYEYIGKTESMLSDTREVLRALNLSGVIEFNTSSDETGPVVEDITRRASQFIDEYDNLSNCISLSSLILRFWQYLTAKGYFTPGAMPPKRLLNVKQSSPQSLKRTISSSAAWMFHRQHSPGSVAKYSQAYARAAYSTISPRQLHKLKDVVKEDCILFGYDLEPDYVFPREGT